MSESDDRFFAQVASRKAVRTSVRAIILAADNVLVQRTADAPTGTGYAFIGGEYELGDTIGERLRRELEEETTARLTSWQYLFVVENFFVHGEHQIHALEHYVLATINRTDVESREAGLVQEWLPLRTVGSADLRPYPVRDLLANDQHEQTRHLVVWGWPTPQPPDQTSV